jgi:hypothetical protein
MLMKLTTSVPRSRQNIIRYEQTDYMSSEDYVMTNIKRPVGCQYQYLGNVCLSSKGLAQACALMSMVS